MTRENSTPPIIAAGPDDATTTLLFAHGAGAGMDSPVLQMLASQIADRGIKTVRFEFEYMAARRSAGSRRPPPPVSNLCEEYRAFLRIRAAERRQGNTLLIGGKSLGGRIASLIADEALDAGLTAGLVCVGYPFHPPGKPDKLRTAHLERLQCPALILQGERDPFGDRAEVQGYKLSPQVSVQWIDDGDHDLRPRRASGQTQPGNLTVVADGIAAFAASLSNLR